MSARAVAGLLAGFAAAVVAPGLASDLSQCAAIAADADRLACYDALAHPAATASPVPAPAVNASAPPPAAAAPASAEAAPANEAAKQAAFGAASLKKNDDGGLTSLQAHLVGHLDETRKGQRYTLDNGQIWLNVDDQDSYVDLDNPPVTISRNFIGTYWMSIEGRNTRVKVRRIQ